MKEDYKKMFKPFIWMILGFIIMVFNPFAGVSYVISAYLYKYLVVSEQKQKEKKR